MLAIISVAKLVIQYQLKIEMMETETKVFKTDL